MSKISAIEAATAVVPLDNLTGFETRIVAERHHSLADAAVTAPGIAAEVVATPRSER